MSNEVKGSFWRPDDYMEKVPNSHVIGAKNISDAYKAYGNASKNSGIGFDSIAASVKLSKSGMNMANQHGKDTHYSSEDGVVRKYSFNINRDELNLEGIGA